jgi:sugar/nucleoside kinase (ribokinase family)
MYDVITIGTASRDVFLSSKSIKILKDPAHLKKFGFIEGKAACLPAGEKIDIPAPVLTTGGGATNAAVTFARQGFKTAAIISISDDPNGDSIVEDLKKEKIKPIISLSDKNSTAYSTLLLAPSGERTILVYRGAADELEIEKIPLSKLQARWVYISPGGIDYLTIEILIDHFRRTGAYIAMNPSGSFLKLPREKILPIFKKVNVINVNRSEASILTKAPYEKEKEIFEKFDEIIDGVALMSDGPKGSQVSDGQTIIKAGIFKEKILADRTGAGDAFGSGFVAGLLQSKDLARKGSIPIFKAEDLEYAVRLGSANATSVVEYIGAKTGIISKKDFQSNSRWQNLSIKRISE